MGKLIDTSIFVHTERGRVDMHAVLAELADETLAIAAITAAELLEGVHRATNDQQRNKREVFVEGVLARIPIVAFDAAAARVYARARCQLEGAGMKVGAHDLQIASTALAIGYDVVTTDKRSFPRVPGLNVILLEISPHKLRSR